MMYICYLIIYLLNFYIMQKTVLSTPAKGAGIKYFKYEMKDTNQLLRDLISCNISETLTRSGQNKEQIHIHDIHKQKLGQRKLQNTECLETKKKVAVKKNNQLDQNFHQTQKNILKYQSQQQIYEGQLLKDLIYEHETQKKRKKQFNPMQELILQKIFIDFSQNEDDQDHQKPSFQKYKNKQLQFNTHQKFEQNKQIKKQKKGLANISLRVKNIVSQHKKLTYKQVSDLVLQYSKNQIDQLNESQKVRQIKNIKRRVYDALNVLVAVGILGKQQRCVCITQWTNVPGKKLSNQWQKINSKIQYINKLKKNCADKSQALNLLIEKYNAISALQKKHELQQFAKKQIVYERKNQFVKIESSVKLEKQGDKLQDKKLMFPVIVFCPAYEQDTNDKLTIEMEHEETNEEQNIGKRQKVKISGKNIAILGDFDCALQMNLQNYRDKQRQEKLLQQIENYANQCLKKRTLGHHALQQDYGQNIEDYFNEQMFESN